MLALVVAAALGGIKVGDRAPDFSVTSHTTNKVSLADESGTEEHGCWLLVRIRLVELSLAIIYTYTIIYIDVRYIWKWKSPFGRRHYVRSSPRIERHSRRSRVAASYLGFQ